MKNPATVLLLVICVASAAALSLLLTHPAYRVASQPACQAYVGGCYMPPPSIHRLLP
ncbi:hypothetical protein FBY03_10674 [Pseudomonas sp. SJZ079]|uniref:hypothetical protein n=1 Tax=Pseudomonas sp. SJZ079 TaxID=2572887 RepID=UPI001199AB0B|nr:hypothetical protein [Pseudomonas sp. SJZ079]TWC38577.1 hypothetical protein FBY03_10674 [Pseudomonas sp. SJZ079]